MNNQVPVAEPLPAEAPGSSELADPNLTPSLASEGIARRRMRVIARMLGSLLLGGMAILGPILVFRQGLLPLIDGVFRPGPEWLVAFRRAGILLSALAGYWAYVRWHEKREVTELRLQPVRLMLAGTGGAGLLALPVAGLFALGAYEIVLVRGVSPGLLGVATVIGIAATLEELFYRCLLFQGWSGPGERGWHSRRKRCCSRCGTWKTWSEAEPPMWW
jgi:uncharacterized protein